MEYTHKEMRAFAVDFAYYVHIKKLGDLPHEKHKELFDEWVKDKLPQAFVSGRREFLSDFEQWAKLNAKNMHDIDYWIAEYRYQKSTN